MRFTRIVKAPLRAMTLVTAFGVLLGLTVPAGPLPAVKDYVQQNEECGDFQSRCDTIQFQGTQAGCLPDVTCVSLSENACYTCRPTSDHDCTNSDTRFGHITCPGLCTGGGTSQPCSFTVYACKN